MGAYIHTYINIAEYTKYSGPYAFRAYTRWDMFGLHGAARKKLNKSVLIKMN